MDNKFSDYYSKTGADGIFATLQGMSGVNARFSNYYDKSSSNGKFASITDMTGVSDILRDEITNSISDLNLSIQDTNSSFANTLMKYSTTDQTNLNIQTKVTEAKNYFDNSIYNLMDDYVNFRDVTYVNGMSGVNAKFDNYYNKSVVDGKFSNYYDMTGANNLFFNKSTIKSILNNSVPVGTIIAYAGSILPTGFLWCDGTSYTRASAEALYAAIGAKYGGTGTTYFNVPNIKSRTIVGVDISKPLQLSLTGGNENTTLTIANMPSHSHTGTTSTTGEHTHDIDLYYGTGGSQEYVSYSGNSAMYKKYKIPSSGAHTHTITTSDAGSGQSFSNMQPYIVLNYIIKYNDASNIYEPNVTPAKQIISTVPVPLTVVNPVNTAVVAENYTSPYFGVF